MRPTRSAFLLFVTFLISVPVAAQQPPRRDPQAVAVLTQCLDAAGGMAAMAGIQDFTASGTVTYAWAGKELTVPATVRGRGLDQFRVDWLLPNGTQSWTVSKGAGSRKDVMRNISPIPYHNAANLGSLTFPLLQISAALHDPTLMVTYQGVAQTPSGQAHRVQVSKNLVGGTDQRAVLSKLTLKDYFIDVTTLRVVSTLYMIHPDNDATRDFPDEIQFSDYRPVNGVLAPFSITEQIGGVRTWVIHLSRISFNRGLGDADFKL